MKRCSILSILVCLVVTTFFLVSFAGAHEKHPKTGDPLIIECGKIPRGVVLDANLDEWKFAKPAKVDVKEQLYSVFKGDWTGPEDCSGIVYMMYSDKYIYVAGEFKDEKLIAQQTGSTIWKDECLEIFFDPENIEMGWPESHQVHYQFGFAPTGPDNEPQVWNWCNPNAGKAQQACDNYVKLASKLLNPYKGYILEGSIEIAQLDELKGIVKPGTTIGYHIAIDDADDDAERDLQITWSCAEAHDQLHFGDLVFTGPLAVSPAGALTTTWGKIKE